MWTWGKRSQAFWGGAGAPTGGKIPLKFKLESLTKSGGKTVAKIDVTMSGDMSMSPGGQTVKMHLQATGFFTVDVATGVTIVSDVKSTNHLAGPGMTMVQNMRQLMKPK